MKLSIKLICRLILGIVLCAGCNKNEPTDLICFNIEEVEGKIIDFDDIFEIEKIIVLEETNESLVSHIIKVNYINNNYYISDNRYSVILRFDDNGKYINSIGAKGIGPGEVIRLTNFRLDKESVYLLDRAKVIKYKNDGTFVEEFYKPYYTIDFNFIDGIFIFYNINVPSYDQFIKYDTTFSIIKSFSPLRESPLVMGMLGREYLFYHEGNNYYTYPYSDTIYRLSDTISTPYISYGFGQNKFTDFTGLLNNTLNDNMSEVSYSYKDFIIKDLIICSLVINGSGKLFIYDVATNNSLLIDSITNGPDLIHYSRLHNVTSDGLFCWGYSVMSENENFKTLLEGLETNGNEVLILTRLKLGKDQ